MSRRDVELEVVCGVQDIFGGSEIQNSGGLDLRNFTNDSNIYQKSFMILTRQFL